MALNHTHDTLDTSLKDETKNKTTKSAAKTGSTEEPKENHEDLLDGRTLLEAEALLIMLITRMKIKGQVFLVG